MNHQQKPDDPIKHVILLMFENHSFDQMLGCFKAVYSDLNGVDPQHFHINRDENGNGFKQAPTQERQMVIDPRHEVEHVATQMQDSNGGFIKDFVAANRDTPAYLLQQQCHYVMGYYPLNFLPALHQLAREFMICDHWFASLPGPTWPNRHMAMTGTALGRVNMPGDGEHTADLAGFMQQTQTTLFDRLSEKGISWKVYFNDIPESACLVNQRKPENAARYFPFSEFSTDCLGLEDHFPVFAFIEPDYNGYTENDDHPPHDIMKAQKFLADVYNAVRSNEPLWRSALLVVLYDEHGGFYDHMEPPSTDNSPLPVPPDDHHEEYAFNQFGIRVPALLVSPWVKQSFTNMIFDHTSLLRYLIDKWSLDPLGNRAASANSIAGLIEKTCRQDALDWIQLTPDQLVPPNPDREDKAAAYLSAHHRSLALLGEQLRKEMDEDLWRWYSVFTRWYLAMKNWLFGRPKTTEAILKDYQAAKANSAAFIAHRKQQAKVTLAAIVSDSTKHRCIRDHAAEALGYVVGRHFHRHSDPCRAAMDWLKSHDLQ